MIVRVFRAKVHRHLHAEFEAKFRTVSVDVVEGQEGIVSLTIGRPAQWAPDEFVMVSTWLDERAIVGMAGEDWSQAHIPAGMEQYIAECWVHHYEVIE